MPANHVNLKNLQRRLNESDLSLKNLKDRAKEYDEKIKREEENRHKIEKEIKGLTVLGENLIVSEHAIVRYFERIKKYDMEEVKREILPEIVEAKVKMLGDGEYPVNGYRIKVRDNVVITII